ncbi:MAG: acyl carrier protein [Paludibacteraceae bacterium]|nr:acyl carrier protein [Paludibacteraceae bacterium]
MSEIFLQVQNIIVEKLGIDESKVTMDANFSTDLNADSLDTVELIFDFEKTFGIEIPEEDAEGIVTVGDAVAYVEKALAEKNK